MVAILSRPQCVKQLMFLEVNNLSGSLLLVGAFDGDNALSSMVTLSVVAMMMKTWWKRNLRVLKFPHPNHNLFNTQIAARFLLDLNSLATGKFEWNLDM